MANRTDKGRFAPGVSGNPRGRPKLPAEIKEMFQAKGPEALAVLARCLESSDDRIAIAAATAILDRGYGRPSQTIDASISEESVRLYALLPRPCATTEEWLESVRRTDARRALVTDVAVVDDDEHKQH